MSSGKTSNAASMAKIIFIVVSAVALVLIWRHYSGISRNHAKNAQGQHSSSSTHAPAKPETKPGPESVPVQVPEPETEPESLPVAEPGEEPPAEETAENVELEPGDPEEFTPISPPVLQTTLPLPEQEMKELIVYLRDSSPFIETDFLRRAGRAVRRLKGAGMPAWEGIARAMEKEDDDFARGRLNAALACMRWGFSAYYIWELDSNFIGELYATRTPEKGEWYSSLETFFKAGDAPKLVQAFSLNDPHASHYIFDFVQKLGSAALKPLLEALSEDHPYFMFCVRIALMRIAPSLVRELKAMANDKKPEIRSRAVWALGLSGSNEAVPLLCRALKDEMPTIRSSAAYMLGMIPDRRSVGFLAAALEDSDEETRAFAAQALGIIGDPSAIKPLVNYVKNGDADAKREGASALAGIGEQAAHELMVMLKSESAQARAAAAAGLAESASASALKPLIDALSDSDSQVRAAAANALGRLGGSEAEKALSGLLSDKDPELRSAGVYALGQMRARGSEQALTGLLEDKDARVRMAAISALCRTGGARALVALVESLGNPELAPLTINGIKNYGRNAGPVLVDTFPKLPPDGKCTVARLLAEIKHVRGVPILIDGLADNDIDVRFCSQKALRIITGHETSYKCDAADTERAKGQEEWREWWKNHEKEGR